MSLREQAMNISDYDFELPEELIARYPLEERTASRLLVYDALTNQIQHKNFRDIVDILRPGDILLRNNTKVLAARLYVSKKTDSKDEALGSKIEILLIKKQHNQVWDIMAKPGKKLKDGLIYELENGIEIKVIKDEDKFQVDFGSEENFCKAVQDCGSMPIPPYMKRSAEAIDAERYQTTYAREHDSGVSVAAPTAGLHFNEEIDRQLVNKGIEILELTLHVGIGTFAPIKTENILDHKMHSEFYEIAEDTWNKIQLAKKSGRRVIAVGSTSTRVLESVARTGILAGETDIFIYPGKEFMVVDGMITNFHLPKSSLIVMITAFLGEKAVKDIYSEAISNKYRFYSYGDTSLLLKC
jgi:S-adenosylmethionine:tRNA ribosyltransferase-isomerase